LPQAPNEKIKDAKALFDKGVKLIDIANQLDLPSGTVRRWKCTYKWGGERSDSKSERSPRKRGAQPGNKNSKGAPVGNKRAEKNGFYSKYLPAETIDIIHDIEHKAPIDIIVENIRIQYAAIIRAQQIMHVRDKEDCTTTVTADGEKLIAYEYQQAWDKQANFLKAQSRAFAELRSLIKQYEVMKISANNENGVEDDGFIEAIKASAKSDWGDSAE
jgi:Uncharacterized conserved protein